MKTDKPAAEESEMKSSNFNHPHLLGLPERVFFYDMRPVLVINFIERETAGPEDYSCVQGFIMKERFRQDHYFSGTYDVSRITPVPKNIRESVSAVLRKQGLQGKIEFVEK